MIFHESPPADWWAVIVDRIWVELRRPPPGGLVLSLSLSQGPGGVCQFLIATASKGVYQRQPGIRRLDKSHFGSRKSLRWVKWVVLGSTGLFRQKKSDELVEVV